VKQQGSKHQPLISHNALQTEHSLTQWRACCAVSGARKEAGRANPRSPCWPRSLTPSQPSLVAAESSLIPLNYDPTCSLPCQPLSLHAGAVAPREGAVAALLQQFGAAAATTPSGSLLLQQQQTDRMSSGAACSTSGWWSAAAAFQQTRGYAKPAGGGGGAKKGGAKAGGGTDAVTTQSSEDYSPPYYRAPSSSQPDPLKALPESQVGAAAPSVGAGACFVNCAAFVIGAAAPFFHNNTQPPTHPPNTHKTTAQVPPGAGPGRREAAQPAADRVGPGPQADDGTAAREHAPGGRLPRALHPLCGHRHLPVRAGGGGVDQGAGCGGGGAVVVLRWWWWVGVVQRWREGRVARRCALKPPSALLQRQPSKQMTNAHPYNRAPPTTKPDPQQVLESGENFQAIERFFVQVLATEPRAALKGLKVQIKGRLAGKGGKASKKVRTRCACCCCCCFLSSLSLGVFSEPVFVSSFSC